MSDLDRYIERIGVSGPLRADLATLRALHVAHMGAIPFENASVLFHEPIELDADGFVHKLGVLGRGGFCYELNGALATLLRSVGFDVELLEARVYNEGELGQRHDHLALRVTLDEPWLVDVGFGYSFLEPLRLAAGADQQDPAGAFRLLPAHGGFDVEWRRRDGRWVPHYWLDPTPTILSAFADACRSQQTSQSSPFIGGWICSLSTPTGATTMVGRHLIVTDGPARDERDLTDDAVIETLASVFAIRARRTDGRWERADVAVDA